MRWKTGILLCKSSVAAGFVISLVLLLAGCALFNSSPVARFVMSPPTGEAPLTVNFDASGSSDTGGNIVSYEWDFGDGGSETGLTVKHTFNTAGTYKITLTVTDNHGKVASTAQILTVAAGSSSLVARFVMSPTTGEAPLTVNFDASGSSDTGGNIVSYEWDFGDGGSGTGVKIEHIFNTAGTYKITLTVTDNHGKVASTAQILTVTAGSSSLVARFVMLPATGKAPLTVNFDASGSSDTDGSIVSYEWDFGDGGSETGLTVKHTFNTAGTYKITLTVTDNRGRTASVAQKLIVTAGGSPPPPPPPPAG